MLTRLTSFLHRRDKYKKEINKEDNVFACLNSLKKIKADSFKVLSLLLIEREAIFLVNRNYKSVKRIKKFERIQKLIYN